MINKTRYYPFLLSTNSSFELLNSEIRNVVNILIYLRGSKLNIFNTAFSGLEQRLYSAFWIRDYTTPDAHISFLNVSFE